MSEANAVPTAQNAVVSIPLEQLFESKANPRKHFDPVKLDELADSIRANGIILPLVVRPHTLLGNGKRSGEQAYEIVAGSRRFRAATLAQLDDAPCLVRELDDTAALEVQVIENLQREDVQPLEEADSYKRLLDGGTYDVPKLADRVGKSEKFIYDRIKLLQLVPEAQKALEKGEMTAGHAIVLARRDEAEQRAILHDIDMTEMPVKEFERDLKWRDEDKKRRGQLRTEEAKRKRDNAAFEAKQRKQQAKIAAENKQHEALRKREVEFREELLIAAVKEAGAAKHPKLAIEMMRWAAERELENSYGGGEHIVARALGNQDKDLDDAQGWLAKYIAKANDLQSLVLYLLAVTMADSVDYGGKDFERAIAEHLPAKQLAAAKAKFAAETKRLAKLEKENAATDKKTLAKAKKTGKAKPSSGGKKASKKSKK